jgi:hypothetical protein
MTNQIALAMKVTNSNANASLLLLRLAYWTPKAKVVRNDQTWVVKSGEDWSDETGMSLKQYKIAVNLLKELGLIATEKHFFANKTLTHMRFTEKGLDALKGPTGKAQMVPTGRSRLGPTKNKGDTTREILQEKTSSSSARIAHAKNSGASNSGEKAVKPKSGMSVKDIMSNYSSTQKTKELLHQTDPKTALELVWNSTVAGTYGVYVPPLTLKHKSQLAKFSAACPKGKSVLLLNCVLKNWGLFVSNVKTATGESKAPSLPSPGFLLVHKDVAITFALDMISTQQDMPPAVQSIALAPAPKVSPAPQEKKASLEDFLSIFSDENDDD